MLARQKWQIKTIAVLEKVFNERVRQHDLHGEALKDLPDGTGPDVQWLQPFAWTKAENAQRGFREDYEDLSETEELTKMHVVREELAEAFELEGDSPEFVDEILQVAALCVQWAEIKMEENG